MKVLQTKTLQATAIEGVKSSLQTDYTLRAGERQSSVFDEVIEFDAGPRRLTKRERRMGVGSSDGRRSPTPRGGGW
ncbi:Pleiotropic drug resistance protein [Musa troglodytarum]|uniref:Pleiotropic drug resistance protein n=1 Tax=Musa troglodytarum TaxID=320322 RepID=A0A9E7EQG4_9LILI|nr:Pleiotropic drug resistance protein [Musa troglodytarum]